MSREIFDIPPHYAGASLKHAFEPVLELVCLIFPRIMRGPH